MACRRAAPRWRQGRHLIELDLVVALVVVVVIADGSQWLCALGCADLATIEPCERRHSAKCPEPVPAAGVSHRIEAQIEDLENWVTSELLDLAQA